eukprot:CAMPEP_0171091962 /NCGR_PEP_ID=MMETSP0766_2-20121228/35423_1 /TAXON_ID=439317 /ORGANISM="Gambierdiscus australes, Strain CAWD 149" /LENGTH=205 /DNA_ID=CAMNT_0011550149 /DNA_START=101 /DNA_END=718 /DNA_ORIENTATION=+
MGTYTALWSIMWRDFPKVAIHNPSITDPKETSWVSEALDDYFDFEECWERIIRALKSPSWPWVLSCRIVRESEFEFSVTEKVSFFKRTIIGRHIVNPRENMVESRYLFAKEFPKYNTEDPLFMQWIILHNNPVRLEGWRRRMDDPDQLLHDEGTGKFFNEFLKALVVMEPDDFSEAEEEDYDDPEVEAEAEAELERRKRKEAEGL